MTAKRFLTMTFLTCVVLTALAAVACMAFAGIGPAVGSAIGGLLAALNFLVLGLLVLKILGGKGRKLFLFIGIVLKMTAFLGAVFLVMKYFPDATIGVAIGVSTTVAALFGACGWIAVTKRDVRL